MRGGEDIEGACSEVSVVGGGGRKEPGANEEGLGWPLVCNKGFGV